MLAAAPRINVSVTNVICLPGASASFVAIVRGTEPIGLQWQKDDVDISAETNATLSFSALTWTDSGSYRLRATNESGITFGDPVNVAVVNAAIWNEWVFSNERSFGGN